MKRFLLFLAASFCLSAVPYAAKNKSRVAFDPTPARLHWIGKTPEAAKPVSFGIPFLRGELKPSDAFSLTTDKGQVIPADFWPTAYWPDGSVKWGGFATVVPGGTESVLFRPVPVPSRGGNAEAGMLMQAVLTSASTPVPCKPTSQRVVAPFSIVWCWEA